MFTASPTYQAFSPMFHNMGRESPAAHGPSIDQSLMEKVSHIRMPDNMQNMPVMKTQGTEPRSIMPTTGGSCISTMASPAHPPPSAVPPNVSTGVRSPYGNGSKQRIARMEYVRTNQRPVSNGAAVEVADHSLGRPPQPQFTNIYSASGFDMLGVLVSVTFWYQSLCIG